MGLLPRIVYDVPNENAEINLYIESFLETTYFFNSGVFTLEERESLSQFDSVTFSSNIILTNEWLNNIFNKFTIPNQTSFLYKTEYERKANEFVLEFSIEGNNIIECDYNYNTKLFTFQPTFERTLSFNQISMFSSMLSLVSDARFK